MIERENREHVDAQEVCATVSMRDEPRSVVSYCCASGPQPFEVRELGAHRRSGYTHCPVWRAECARREKRAKALNADDVNYGGAGNRF